jgi:ubiquinone/menaquinone biosynthesis C-methylase UbiE/protein-disulfide isomerase-like protein with CxxC motif
MEPVVRRIEEVYRDSVKVTLRMGGMFENITSWLAEERADEQTTTEAVREAGQAAGMPILADYLWRCQVKSTYTACLAFKASELEGWEDSRRFFRRMMEAFMVEGRHGSQDVYLTLAQEAGIPAGRLRRDMELPGPKAGFEEDQHEMIESGAAYDRLLIQNRAGYVVPVEGFTAKPYEDAIDALAPGLPKFRPADILEYAQRRQGLQTIREVAEVFRIPNDIAAERLVALAKAGILESVASEAGRLWRWKGPEPDPLPLAVVRAMYVPGLVPPDVPLKQVLAAAVKEKYEDVALKPTHRFRFPIGPAAARMCGYPEEVLQEVPARALESFSGVGYFFGLDEVGKKDTVLDVGCGSGTDVLIAAKKARSGSVRGIDVNPAMVAKARAAVVAAEAKRVQILAGDAASMGIPSASVDVVTANGLLRFVPDKAGVLRAMAGLLKPGGRLLLAEIASKHAMATAVGPCPVLWADGLGGAPDEADLLRAVEAAGFRDIRVGGHHDYFAKSPSPILRRIARAVGAQSVVLRAVKPEARKRR